MKKIKGGRTEMREGERKGRKGRERRQKGKGGKGRREEEESVIENGRM